LRIGLVNQLSAIDRIREDKSIWKKHNNSFRSFFLPKLLGILEVENVERLSRNLSEETITRSDDSCALACAKRFSDKGFEVDPEGVTRLLGSGAPDRAAERRHKRDGSRNNDCGGYDGEQCR
jgi:hypothetical protein